LRERLSLKIKMGTELILCLYGSYPAMAS
jgi:hypothetical protein